MGWALGSSPSSPNALGFRGSTEDQGQSKQGSVQPLREDETKVPSQFL